jgi:putative ABC transport system permease protein
LPDLPVYASWNYIIMAEILAVVIGVLAGIIPANQAAGMQPVDALRSE